MPDRDLDITKFSFFAYRKLKKALGEFAVLVDCNEIVIRKFLESTNNDDAQKYVQKLSLKHNFKIEKGDHYKFVARIRHYYLDSVFQQNEEFFENFKEEWRNYFNDKEWSGLEHSETVFQNCARNLSLNLSNDLIDIYEYYQLVRNYRAYTVQEIEKMEKSHKKINSNKNEFLSDLNINIRPNSYDKIDFNDFFILINIVKHIGYLFSVSSKPHNGRISDVLFQKSKENEKRIYKGLKKRKTHQWRYRNALKGFTKTVFGRFSNADEAEIINRLRNLLA